MQFIRQLPVTVAEADGTNPFVRRRHQNPAQRTVAQGIGDARTAPALGIGGRGHAELPRGFFIEAARRPVPSSVEGLGHRLAVAQFLLDPPQAQGFRILPRGDADDALENPLQVIGADPNRQS